MQDKKCSKPVNEADVSSMMLALQVLAAAGEKWAGLRIRKVNTEFSALPTRRQVEST